MGQEGHKLWTRSFITLMLVNFTSALSFYLTMVKITQFTMDTYGVNHSVGGSMITAYVIAALFTRLFFGSKIDLWGIKRSVALGAAVNAVAMALYLVPMPFYALMAVRVLHGFGFAIMSGAAAAGAALVIPRDRYGEGIGYFSMMQALASGIGPFVAIYITNTFGGYFPMFATAAVIMFIALGSVALLDIPEDVARKHAAHHTAKVDGEGAGGAAATAAEAAEAPSQSSKGIGKYIQFSALPLAVTLMLCYFGYAGILSFVTLYADERGLADAVTLYFVVYAAVILLTRPPVGRRVDRAGENSVIYWCFVALCVGLVILAFAVNGFMLLASAALIGFGIGAAQSIMQAVIARDTPLGELGRANSTFFMSMDLGSGVGPIVIGAAIPYIGYSGSYLVLAGVAVLAGVVYHFSHGRKH